MDAAMQKKNALLRYAKERLPQIEEWSSKIGTRDGWQILDRIDKVTKTIAKVSAQSLDSDQLDLL